MTSPDTDVLILAMLERIAVSVAVLPEIRAALPDVVEALRRGKIRRQARPSVRSLRPADQMALKVLLPEIVRLIGIGIVFTVADLLQRAGLDKQLRVAFQSVFATMDRKGARQC